MRNKDNIDKFYIQITCYTPLKSVKIEKKKNYQYILINIEKLYHQHKIKLSKYNNLAV